MTREDYNFIESSDSKLFVAFPLDED